MGPHEDAARTSADDRLAPDAPAPDDLVSPSRARAVPPGLRIIGGLFGIAMRDSWRSAVDRWRSAVAGISRGSASRADAAAGLARRVERSRDFPLIADYHRRVSEGASSADLIDDRTWDDLDGDDLFAEVDRCASAPGQQVLYAMLRRTDASDADLDRLDAAAARLAGDAELRDGMRRQLARLFTRDAYFLHNLFGPSLPPRPRFFWIFPLLTLGALAMIGFAFVRPGLALAGLLLIGAANFVVQYRYHARVYMFVAPLTLMNRLIATAKEVSRPRSAPASDALAKVLGDMRAAADRLGRLTSASRHIAFERGDDVVSSMYVWLNALFLLDINAYVFTVSRLQQHRQDLRIVFESVGFVDAALSLASWRPSLPVWCRPERVPRGRALEFSRLVHPLLDDPVANDLRIDGRSVLITGSNMSGKTTFIRAVAANALLARTLATCTAAMFRAPPVNVRSMIGRGASLRDGQSYFAVELLLARRLIEAAAAERQHLFVVDEIFRGTNTTERVAASKAVLQRLADTDHTGFRMTSSMTRDTPSIGSSETGAACRRPRVQPSATQTQSERIRASASS